MITLFVNKRESKYSFSQHGIKVIEEVRNIRVRVSPCGQF